MIERYIKVKCDNCDVVMDFYNFQVLDVYSAIRARNWAVSKNRKYTFCPKCKIKVTSPGRNGYNKLLPFSAKKARDDERMLKYLQEEEERMQAIYLQECEEFARMNGD